VRQSTSPISVRIEHPSGHVDLRLEYSGSGESLTVERAGTVRTARLIMRGEVYAPSRHDAA
jgi:4-oxalomesaconate tautomerase